MKTDVPEVLIQFERRMDSFGLKVQNIVREHESQEYAAFRFEINKQNIIFRHAKTTPKKVGQFVTLWKRNQEGVTQPFESNDNFDFIIIITTYGTQFGQFIFPKTVLLMQGVLSGTLKQGKRGIRVYPSWDKTTNLQAQKTQKWQLDFFFETSAEQSIDAELNKRHLVSLLTPGK